jgi:hypothetical protein
MIKRLFSTVILVCAGIGMSASAQLAKKPRFIDTIEVTPIVYQAKLISTLQQ